MTGAWLFLAWLPLAEGSWQLGAAGASCTATCTGLTKTCDFNGQRQLNSNFEFDYVFQQLVGTGQIPTQFSSGCSTEDYYNLPFAQTAQPATVFTFYIVDGTFYATLDPQCYQFADQSDCEGTFGDFRRLCCCLTNPGDDYRTECFVPTTTTSTQTATVTSTSSSATQTQTQTTTSETTTSVTTVTSQTTTSTSVTATDTTLTATVTTQTTTSQTTSSSTETVVTTTVTYFSTQTSTTETTSSLTSSSSTATTETITATATTATTTLTTFTATSTTTTVTAAASTLITSNVPAGSSVIPVADRTGFSEEDMISIGREVVKIENITAPGRRLEDEEDWGEDEELFERRLAGAANLEVTPPVTESHSAGASIQNLGPASTYTGSDPITFHGGQKIKFWLPQHQEFLLLETKELRIFGTCFPGPKVDQQWFGHFRVLLKDDTPVVSARVKEVKNQTLLGTRCGSKRMDSMDILIGRSLEPMQQLLKRPTEYTAGADVRFAIDCRRQDRPLLASARTEYIHVETPSIAFLIVAAHAGNEFPNDLRLQLKYQHLDLLILEMPRKQEFRGLLPEIWGIRPRSPEVEGMLSPPLEPLAPTACADQRTSPVCLS